MQSAVGNSASKLWSYVRWQSATPKPKQNCTKNEHEPQIRYSCKSTLQEELMSKFRSMIGIEIPQALQSAIPAGSRASRHSRACVQSRAWRVSRSKNTSSTWIFNPLRSRRMYQRGLAVATFCGCHLNMKKLFTPPSRGPPISHILAQCVFEACTVGENFKSPTETCRTTKMFLCGRVHCARRPYFLRCVAGIFDPAIRCVNPLVYATSTEARIAYGES